MTLIRSKSAGPLVKNAVVLDLGDIAKQGEMIKKQCRSEAKRILAHARSQAEVLVRKSAENGFAEGKKLGYAEGIKNGQIEGRAEALDETRIAMQSLMQAWSDSLETLNAMRQSLLLDAKLDILKLALEIGERVVYRIIEVDPSIVEDQMVESLRLLAKRTEVTISVSPADFDTAQNLVPDIITQIDACDGISVLSEPGLTPGGCIIQTGGGEIDATIETQLDRIIATLIPDEVHNEPVDIAHQASKPLSDLNSTPTHHNESEHNTIDPAMESTDNESMTNHENTPDTDGSDS